MHLDLRLWLQDEALMSGPAGHPGASHIRFAADGGVVYHRDYQDAAEELYEKLPVLGILMRRFRRQAAKEA